MTTLIKTELVKPVDSNRDLVDYLARGARSREKWGIGTEMEKLVVDSGTGEAAPYAKIETLLSRLEQTGQWRGIREEGHLVALVGENSSITLEPGGQLELSGQLCPDLHCSYGDFAAHIRQISGQARCLGLTFLGLGVQPFTPLEKIDWLPKARYKVMGPYMTRTGDRGQHMMKMTAGLQVNIDFANEKDCIEKLCLGQFLSPILYALFANSPIMQDRPTGFLSTRGDIWSRTDPDRCGFIPQLFQAGAGFQAYVDFALDVPMYFIVRDGKFLDLTRQRFPFCRYLAEGFQDHRATLGDWDLHLSTLFPEVRLRPQIEFRSADSLPPHLSLGVSALIKGIFYDQPAQEEFRDLFGEVGPDELNILYRQSWQLGLKAPFRKTTLRTVARRAFDISKQGLINQARQNARGMDETIFLGGIEELIDRGQTLAERLLASWGGTRQEKLALLRDHCGFDSF